ncbi:hypothetical protein PUN28_017961 [Cardiocondyla obscurior]|uniref:Uncharacterized protein n=1 Tax=Cardiocondyla obscurior TaxID=286306 RepID=A0AAW2EF81_9HYME
MESNPALLEEKLFPRKKTRRSQKQKVPITPATIRTPADSCRSVSRAAAWNRTVCFLSLELFLLFGCGLLSSSSSSIVKAGLTLSALTTIYIVSFSNDTKSSLVLNCCVLSPSSGPGNFKFSPYVVSPAVAFISSL